MRVVRPGFVRHPGESGPREVRTSDPEPADDKDLLDQTIYSLDISRDGSRLATGSLDQTVRIWSTAAIVDPALEDDASVAKLLCTCSAHTGAVLCCRWNSTGRYLASGADDARVIVWELDRCVGDF